MVDMRRRLPVALVLAGFVLVALLGPAVGVVAAARPAAADTVPPAGTPATVSADALPTVQVDGVVWKTAVVGGTGYAVGRFTRARPAGTAPGDPAEVRRSNALAFDLTSGGLLPFAPELDAQALTVAPSPDGSTVYVGGDFTTVGGEVRSQLAAFDTASGALTAFAPSLNAQVRALAVTDTTVFAGGVFGSVAGATRKRLAAFSRGNGALLPWAPSADDDQVEALVAAPDGSRVVVGGRFQSLNGRPQVGIGAVDGRSGATLPWSSRPIPTRTAAGRSWVTDLTLLNGVVYGGADGEGGRWFDGRFAASLLTGDLVWLDNCYGATYGVFATGGVVYSASHAHDCASLGAFPQTDPPTYRRALAETASPAGFDPAPPGTNSNYSHQPVPRLLTWFPDINIGSVTGQNQGAWAVSGNARYVVMAGEFTKVNGVPQQGLVRFAGKALAPNRRGPVYSSALLPTAVSLRAGTVRVRWPATWDPDNDRLRYELFRDTGTTPVYRLEQGSTGWTTTNPTSPTGPAMGFVDTGLVPGSTHRYRLKVSDPFGNNLDNMRTPPVVVSMSAPGPYARDVLADGASAYWRLGESGPTAYDSVGLSDAARGTGVVAAGPGAVAGDDDGAAAFDGSPAGLVATRTTMPAPPALSIEAWVRTTTTAGGKIVGYGSAPSGSSTYYDRQLVMDNAGRVSFGVFRAGTHTLTSPAPLNDGRYHHLVGTLDPAAGMAFYVDGVRVSADPATTAGQDYTGYWRIGGDAVGGWPDPPASSYLAGTIDEVAVYATALPAGTVSRHYTDGVALPAAGPYARDSFGRTVDQGLGVADVGGAWALLGGPTAFGVAGGSGILTAVAGRGPSAYLPSVSSTDTDLRVDVTTDRPATGSGIFVSVLGRRVPGAGDYRAKVHMLPSGGVGLSLSRAAGDGAETALVAETTVPALSYSPGSVLSVRLVATGTGPTTLRAKLWPASAPEPAGWLVAATDATAALQAPGAVGVMHYLSSTATASPVAARFDNFWAGLS